MKDEKTIREQAIEAQEKRYRQLEQLVDDMFVLYYEYGLCFDEMDIVHEMVKGRFEITEIFANNDDEEFEEEED